MFSTIVYNLDKSIHCVYVPSHYKETVTFDLKNGRKLVENSKLFISHGRMG